MSWFSQLFSRPSRTLAEAPTPVIKPERRQQTSSQTSAATAADPVHIRRRSDRAIRRDVLHGVVREAMIGMDILSFQYKFKVMSVDLEGTQFLVLVDLSNEVSLSEQHLREMESAIIARALNQRQLCVNAVYWRVTDPVVLVHKRKKTDQAAPHPSVVTPAERRTEARRKPSTTTPSGFANTEFPQDRRPLLHLGDSQFGE